MENVNNENINPTGELNDAQLEETAGGYISDGRRKYRRPIKTKPVYCPGCRAVASLVRTEPSGQKLYHCPSCNKDFLA